MLTRGHFFFAEPETPHLPYPHDFYSATWTNGEDRAIGSTGPLQDAPRRWRNGSLDIAYPPAIPYGSRRLFDGELTYPDDLNIERLRAGIPEACWTQFGFPFLPLDTVSDLNNCCLRLAYIRILHLTYANELQRITDFFQSWLGPNVLPDFFAENGLLPAITFVATAQYAIMFVTGTTNFQQLAAQALEGLAGPEDLGVVSTMRIWFDLASYIARRLSEAGIGANVPLILVGHSYGAAGCAVAAIRARQANPTRKIFLLTFGMPKPSNNAGMRVLDTVTYLHVFNRGDVVMQVPLSAEQCSWFPALITFFLSLKWAAWKEAPEYLIQEPDGAKQIGNLPSLAADILAPIVVDAVGGQPLRRVLSHQTEEYIRRCCLRCNCPRWPFDEDSWKIIFPLGCAGPLIELGAAIPPMDALALKPLKLDLARLLFGKANPQKGSLAFISIDPQKALVKLASAEIIPSAGELLLTTLTTNCPCCATVNSPSSFTVRLRVPGWELDDTTWTCNLTAETGYCYWQALSGPPNDLDIYIESTAETPDLRCQLGFFNDDPLRNISTAPDMLLPVSGFSCSPWSFALVFEIYVNGVASGVTGSLTVESVP